LKQLERVVLSALLITAFFSTTAFAKDNPRDVLTKTFQQSELWTQGPVKLVAHMRMPKPDGTDINFDYTLSWAGPDKWRAEWTANGFDQVTVLNNGKLSYVSTQPKPLVQPLQFEAAVAALDGFNPAGPYTVPPLDFMKAKIDSSKKKVGNVDARCMALGDPLQTFCVDPSSGHLLSVTNSINGVEVGSYEYSDYTTLGTTAYPQTIKVYYVKTLLEEGKLTLTRGEKFDDKLFAPPDQSTSVDFPSCADVDKNFTAPEQKKSVPAKMPDAAKKAKKYGLVYVMANVGTDGSVQKATAIAGDPDLIAAAADAVQQYKFNPYMRCGKPAQFQKMVIVPFAPPQRPADEPLLPSR